MSTPRPYELLARFSKDGTIAGVSVRTITTIDGKDFEGDPTPLSGANDPAFVAFAEQFSASVLAENALLKTQFEAANARIESLLKGMPWNPRVMEASAFIARISSQELLLLASSTDPMLQQIIGMLNRWKANDWPIVLDSPEIQQSVGYLAQQGIVAQSRIVEVLRDCTREESYVADE